MSRADEERANYQNKISQIKANLIKEISNGRANSSIFTDVFDKINEQIDEAPKSDSDGCSSEGECEESKQQNPDFSMSTIKVGPFSEEALVSNTLFSEDVIQAAQTGHNVTAGGDNYKQTNLKSYFKK